jgi:hypothetical protein
MNNFWDFILYNWNLIHPNYLVLQPFFILKQIREIKME